MALRKYGENYLKCLEEMKKLNELQSIKNILIDIENKVIQLSLFYTQEATGYLSVKYQPFSLDSTSKGVILYKQLLTNTSAVSCLKTEVVLKYITDAFFLLDNQMRFQF